MRRAVMVAGLLAAGWMGMAEADVLGRAKETGMLRLGYRTDAVPFSFNDATGLPAGYSIELCKSVVEAVRGATGRPDLQVEWKQVGAGDRFDVLAKGEADILYSADSVTLGRREQAGFSLLTFVSGQSLLYHADGPSTFEALSGQKVGVRAGTPTEADLRRGLEVARITAEIVPVQSHEEGVQRLASGELAAYFGDGAILLFQLLRSLDRARLKMAERPLGIELYALPLPKGDEAFRLLVDRTLARLYRSREIERVFIAAFGTEAKSSELLRALYILGALPD
jgi:polar amino acid transport system substrate-binding protein/glutamate/aspartate transport system substrate-binding protein